MFFILECPLLYSPLRIHTLLYLLFPLLVVDLTLILCLVSLVIFVHLSTIKQRRTEKLVAVPCNISELLSIKMLPGSKASQSNIRFATTLKDPTLLSQP